jgi:hypothetical protein
MLVVSQIRRVLLAAWVCAWLATVVYACLLPPEPLAFVAPAVAVAATLVMQAASRSLGRRSG